MMERIQRSVGRHLACVDVLMCREMCNLTLKVFAGVLGGEKDEYAAAL